VLVHTLAMSSTTPAPQPSDEGPQPTHDSRVEELRATIRKMISWLPPAAREDFLRELGVIERPASHPKAGDVLATIVQLLPKQKRWTVAQLKQKISEQGVSAKPKEIYNALGYLTRHQHITRIAYGRYLVDGMEVVTSDDLGGATTRHEDEYRTNRD
jgi:hypothetical protein